MDMLAMLVGWTLLTWAGWWVWMREKRRREAKRDQLPPGLPVVTFRPRGVTPAEEAELVHRFQQERLLQRALQGRRWTPNPQVRA